MKKILLTQGKFALVDDEDFVLLSRFKWCAVEITGNFYAQRSERGKKLFMHRVILEAKKGLMVDHKNHDGLDNRRSNLRLCSNKENQWNCKKAVTNSSGYRGVFRHGTNWSFSISHNNKSIKTHGFKTKEDAAKAFDREALRLRGDFAQLNLAA